MADRRRRSTDGPQTEQGRSGWTTTGRGWVPFGRCSVVMSRLANRRMRTAGSWVGTRAAIETVNPLTAGCFSRKIFKVIVDWGNVPSWISAVGSIAAFSVATWAARAAWKQVAHLNEQREIEQASKVSAWLTLEKDTGGTPDIILNLLNVSDLPIYNLEVAVPRLTDQRELFPVVPPTNGVMMVRLKHASAEAKAGTRDLHQRFGSLLQPGPFWDNTDEEQKRALLRMSRATAFEDGFREAQRDGVLLWFRDCHNIIWQRTGNGELRKAHLGSKGEILDQDYLNGADRVSLRIFPEEFQACTTWRSETAPGKPSNAASVLRRGVNNPPE